MIGHRNFFPFNSMSKNIKRMINDRLDLSPERAPYRDKTATFRKQPSDRK
jgi:hypothetical protein